MRCIKCLIKQSFTQSLLARQLCTNWNQIRLKSTKNVLSYFSDHENNDKRRQREITQSGFESETEQIQATLNSLAESGSEWSAWSDDTTRTPRGVPTNAIPLRCLKQKSKNHTGNIFVDRKLAKFWGGKGGDGMICMLRLFCNPMAGPSGGDGGNGGHVILVADQQCKDLQSVKKWYKAICGEPGMIKDMFGANGDHLFVSVPIGTLVKDPLTGKLIADLDVEGSKFIAARGGSGGKGNHYFLSDKNRHPNVAEVGAKGDENEWLLEMKLMAHTGLVGFPNAGKSTLLQAISRAKPTVASYPFTTLQPHVGIVHYDDFEQLAVADLPGLVEGAHRKEGLGHEFLRHIERCVCLFYVIDLSIEKPWKQMDSLMFELEQYRKGLSKRPHAVVANKCDLPGAEHNLRDLEEHLKEHEFRIIPISAKYGTNISELLKYFRELYDLYNYDEDRKQLVW